MTAETAESSVRAHQSAPRTRSRLFRALWLLLGIVLLMGLAYGGARLQVQPRIDALEAELQESRQRIAQLEASDADLRSQLIELEARRFLSMALAAFDAHNYGIARDHLAEAAKLLSNSEEHSELAAEVATMQRTLQEDSEPQRAELRGLGEKFDRTHDQKN